MRIISQSIIRNYKLESGRLTQEIFAKMIARLNLGLGEKRLRSAADVVYHASEGTVHSLIASQETEIDREEIIREVARLFSAYLQTLR